MAEEAADGQMAEGASETAASRPTHPGLILGVARFYYDPRGSMRGMLDSHPSEARLLAYLVIGATFALIGILVQLQTSVEGDLIPRVLENTVSTLFFLPLFMYLCAVIAHVIARAFSGDGRWYHGRCAMFWGFLVSAPIVLMSTLAALALSAAPRLLQVAVSEIGSVFTAFALAHCFAEAYGFRRTWLVFLVIIAPIVIGL
ncbi:MAG: YIP1 family protein, partial [Pseudomonadota bacterium]